MAKKKKQDVAADEILKKQKRDIAIKLGFDIQEFFGSQAGQYMLGLCEQEMAVMMKDTHQAKYEKKHPKAGEYLVQSYEDLCTMRGFTNGIQWVLDLIPTHVNKAKRMERDRRKEEKDKPET